MSKAVVSIPEYFMRDDSGVQYPQFVEAVKKSCRRLLKGPKSSTPNPVPVAIFQTDAKGLFDLYLSNLSHTVQVHTCDTCRQFFDRYGSLVVIDSAGRQHPLMWSIKDEDIQNIPFYDRAILDLHRAVARARITNVFLTENLVLGSPITGDWSHFAVKLPDYMEFAHPLLSLDEKVGALIQDHETVERAIREFSLDSLQLAVGLLKTDAMYRSEAVLGPAQWLYNLKQNTVDAKSKQQYSNHIWREIATAPDGFKHPRNSMIGSLIEDLESGIGLEAAKKNFNYKLDPTKYQRPTSAPKEGNINQAEKIIAKLDSSGSLKRRYAVLEDLQETLWAWKEQPKKKQPEGTFAHLRDLDTDAANRKQGQNPTKHRVTFAKFTRDVLPDAIDIRIFVPNASSNFTAFVTADDPEAPPILQWDTKDIRNPVSWYVYPHSGSLPSAWHLHANTWHKVTAIANFPHTWNGRPATNIAPAALFVIEGCRDTSGESGLGLFPEILKSEYHSIRATIEAHSVAGKIKGAKHASACGLGFRSKGSTQYELVVTNKGGLKTCYTVDRWD